MGSDCAFFGAAGAAFYDDSNGHKRSGDRPSSLKPQADANARNVSTSDGKLSANPKSSIRPDKNAGAVTVEGGSYRFVTGSQGKRSYRLKTPYGALDVRG
jgi:hypothetical protein